MNTQLPTDTDDTAFLISLRDLDRTCEAGRNKHHSAIVLICACIDEGRDTSAAIVSTLGELGYDGKHVRIVLHYNSGNDPQHHH